MILDIPDDWLPTSENINALPRPLRDYIMRLHANTDPAGELRRAMVAEMERDALRKMIEEAPAGVARGDWLGNTLAEFIIRAEGDDVMRFADVELDGKRVSLVVIE
jgi:hypothetical protein